MIRTESFSNRIAKACLYILITLNLSSCGGDTDYLTSVWTWMSGSSVVDQSGVYGTKGTADAANVPGGRQSAVSWIDASGDMWLFGGSGFDSAGTDSQLNDLWRWDGINWTWVSGSNLASQAGVYGTKGVANAANIPGARQNSISWIDASGNLWLFGGFGNDGAGGVSYLNDLWRWDGANWTWISGSNVVNQSGVYGTKGVANAANVPGARQYSVSWIDASGDLWLFGGNGYDSAGTSDWLNDLWRWDGANWTWMSGSDVVNQPGVYGTIGVANAANVPGARNAAVSWIDSSGDLWLFGGSVGSTSVVNDLWRWDGTNWTWMSGSNVVNQIGVYGTKGTADAANVPGARSFSTSWIDASGNMWLFSGIGADSVGAGGILNDLWHWDGANWTWMSGSEFVNALGVYGTKGTADAANVPGARLGAISWIDASGNLWMFGGNDFGNAGPTGERNDLWQYTP